MKFFPALTALLLSLATLGVAQAQPLRIGVTPGSLADSAQIAAREAKAQGLDVQIVEFTDWTLPNTALVNGDLDLNYYQHQAFLDTFNRENRQDLRAVAVGSRGNIGIFSKRYKSLDSLPTGASVALANDTSNQARAIATLRDAGLVTLRANAPQLAQIDDIASNPKKLKFIEVAGPQLARALDDADITVVSLGGLLQAGQLETARQGLYYSVGSDAFWAIHFVTRADNVKDARVRKFIDIYQQSPAVRQQIHASYANESRFYSLPWLK
ncbi:MetQ/NlpA family ABC transporter substrate-binding protein [Comamonas sediminis]|uniref:MetQ/NlpA family ABC transporter substrate-binding protein n=1 Tax=Comamonas sediminis TaxID=1783360 RepID=A0ABV4B1R4_9BURK